MIGMSHLGSRMKCKHGTQHASFSIPVCKPRKPNSSATAAAVAAAAVGGVGDR